MKLSASMSSLRLSQSTSYGMGAPQISAISFTRSGNVVSCSSLIFRRSLSPTSASLVKVSQIFTKKADNVYDWAESAVSAARLYVWRATQMGELKMLLDPTKLGREAEKLEADLRKRIVGQEEAVRQLVPMYQTFVAG